MKLLPSLLCGLEGRLRRLSGPPEGTRRQYRHGRFRPVGLCDVFHAERVVPVLPARAGERPGPVELPDAVRDRENSVRQLHPRHAGRGGSGAARALLRASGSLLAEPPMRQAFGRLGGRTLIAWDGTEYFCSQKLGCPHCLTRKRTNGKIESYHTMLSATVVAPGHAKVVPLMPEFIAPQDGAEKQDCERNAVKRWFDKHRARLAPLRPVYLGDDLFACQPIARMVTDNGDDFIFTAKETSHKALYDFIDGAERRSSRGKSPQRQDDRDIPLPLDRGRTATRRQGRDAGQLDRLPDPRRQRRRQILDGLGHEPCLSRNTTSPKSSPAAGRAGRSRTKAST